ncbi:hypothetical protein [Lachnoclostridium phytofermentans]|uniref:hypothetical protein n=1 Tax=Lachnoclostridium phytofermentans TaxID=66219 RepID=UPI0004965141|nr:hypothetical protein [Lachnoclostridium phytofermentans]
MQGERNKVLGILDVMGKDNLFQEFKYLNQFTQKWKELLEKVDENIMYAMSNEEEKDQIYIFSLPIKNDIMEFGFSIKYIKDFYKLYPNYKIKITFDNIKGRLFNAENECYYTHFNNYDLSNTYDNMEEIFVVPFSQANYNFMLIDGNHRVNWLINHNEKQIDMLYVNYMLAAKSLVTPIQICAYCLMEDYSKIRYNINKVEHERLYKLTNIFDKSKTLNTIGKKRYR